MQEISLKSKYTALLFLSITIGLLAIIIMTQFYYIEVLKDYIVFGIIILFNVVILLTLLLTKKIDIQKTNINIRLPLKKIEYNIEELAKIDVSVIKGSGGSGPGFIEFPNKRLDLVFKNGKKYHVTSKYYKNIDSFLQQLEKIRNDNSKK